MLVVWFVDGVLRNAGHFEGVERPERSEPPFGDLCRSHISRRWVGAMLVVFLAMIAAKHFHLQFAPECFHVEELVALANAETLAVGVLPR
jgi:hypothetical protein